LIKAGARKAAASVAPRLTVSVNRISIDHPDKDTGSLLFTEALGSADPEFANGIIAQLEEAVTEGKKIDEKALGFMVSVIKGIEPRDQIETMLAAQMAAVHMAMMRIIRLLADSQFVTQLDSAERAFNKLARTFTSQVDALKRYRTGGEQKVTVQHVSVSEGGQAIVGNVTQAPRETAHGNVAAAPPELSHSPMSPMTMVGQAAAEPVPVERKSRPSK
jgi:hypothetical protein